MLSLNCVHNVFKFGDKIVPHDYHITIERHSEKINFFIRNLYWIKFDKNPELINETGFANIH